MLVPGQDIREYQVAGARDPVAVATFKDGGLISYRKPDGRYLHTLNTEEGFRRKLQQLGVRIDDSAVARLDRVAVRAGSASE